MINKILINKIFNRVIFSAFAGILLAAGNIPAWAGETESQLSEATHFFNQLAHNSNNPYIVAMAQENLSKLHHAETPKNKVIIPLMMQPDDSLVVPALIENKTMATFLLDTGSTYTVITPRLAQKLGVVVTNETPRVTINTANGSISVPMVTLHQVTIGQVTVPEVKAVIQDLGNDVLLSGLLGMNFFQGMDLSIQQDSLVLGVPTKMASSAR